MVETADVAEEAVVEVELELELEVEVEVEAVPPLLLGRRSGMQSSEVIRKVVSTSREE